MDKNDVAFRTPAALGEQRRDLGDGVFPKLASWTLFVGADVEVRECFGEQRRVLLGCHPGSYGPVRPELRHDRDSATGELARSLETPPLVALDVHPEQADGVWALE